MDELSFEEVSLTAISLAGCWVNKRILLNFYNTSNLRVC